MKKIITIIIMLMTVQINTDAQLLKTLGRIIEGVANAASESKSSKDQEKEDENANTVVAGSNSEITAESPLLKNLTFELPKYLITPNDVGATVRVSPDIRSSKSTQINMESDILYGATELTNGWYKLGERQYVNASGVKVVNPTKPLPQKDFNKHVYGKNYDMDWWLSWRISEVQNTGLTLALVDLGGRNYMYLGKKVGSLFIFKYRVDVSIYRSVDKEKSFFKVSDEVRDNWRYFDIWYGDDYGVMTDNCDIQLDLSRFTEKSILSLFQEVIQKGQTSEFYLDASLLSGKFYNYICD